MGTLGYFVLFLLLFLVGKFIYDSYLTKNTEIKWKEYSNSKSSHEKTAKAIALQVYHKAVNEFDRNEFENALSTIEYLLKFKQRKNVELPFLGELYALKGLSNHGLGKTKEAISDFNLSIKIDPKTINAFLYLLMVELETNNMDGAQQVMERIKLGYYSNYFNAMDDTIYMFYQKIKEEYYSKLEIENGRNLNF
ncbi:hypothetical protein J4E06_07110 [Muricauda sp. NFXS6]|uniref:hypothetical protein n=1 Tax=Allomuricauda sp. NFXS6 TaxID=2819094 RepID=UPI0032DEB28C